MVSIKKEVTIDHVILDLPGIVKGREVQINRICPCCGNIYDMGDGEFKIISCPDGKDRKIMVCQECSVFKKDGEIQLLVESALKEMNKFGKDEKLEV